MQLRHNFKPKGKKVMPYKLKTVLMNHYILQPEWCAAIKQVTGQPLSSSAGNMILNWGHWLKGTPPESIMEQTAHFLRERGVPEEQIATCWEEDENAGVRGDNQSVMADARAKKKVQLLPTAKLDEDIFTGEPEMLSPNAKKHFSIFRSPFVEDVNSPEDVFKSPDIRYIRESIYQTAKHGGMLAVIGESGSGKSTLRKDLIERIGNESEQISVIFPQQIDKKRLSSSGICEAIIRDLRPHEVVPQRGEALARKVHQILKSSADAGTKHVLIIEEAHDITIHVMKLLKRFYEIENGFKKMISIILIGQPELQEMLNENSYPEAREFIRRCEVAWLVPLGNHLEAYLAFKFERVGKSIAEVLAPGAVEAIALRLTDKRAGKVISQLNPLKVNILVTKAMNLAAELGEPLITRELIQQL